jgi:hypothetical protein
MAGRLVFQDLDVLPSAAASSDDGPGLRVAPSRYAASLVAFFGNPHDLHQLPLIGWGMATDPVGCSVPGCSATSGAM